jgi:hypothetical protein
MEMDRDPDMDRVLDTIRNPDNDRDMNMDMKWTWT